MKHPRSGFTLIELLVVLTIIGILVGIMLPAVMFVRERGRQSRCLSNLRQVGLALQTYVDLQGQRGVFPWAAEMPSINTTMPSLTKVLAPYIEANQPVFYCTSDTKYYEREGLSYEYPTARVAGKTRLQLLMRGDVEYYSSSDVWLGYDFDPVHGTPGQAGSRNYVYLDGHAQQF